MNTVSSSESLAARLSDECARHPFDEDMARTLATLIVPTAVLSSGEACRRFARIFYAIRKNDAVRDFANVTDAQVFSAAKARTGIVPSMNERTNVYTDEVIRTMRHYA